MATSANFKLGAVFSSFKDFEKALEEYCNAKSVLFRKVSCKTVEKANQSLGPADVKYDQCLVYRNLTLKCKSGGYNRASESRGIRPNQRTLNLECPAQITLCAETGHQQRLRISKLIETHKHATTPEFVQFYPENRRLRNEADIAEVSGMLACRGQPMDIRSHIRTNLKVCMTTKDLSNIRQKLVRSKRKGRTDEEDLLLEMQDLLTKDPGAVVGLVTSQEVAPLLDILFFQTSSMRELFKLFCEILGMDTTYNTNKHNMHLIVFVVFDNHKNGRVVAICFVRRETKDLIECAVVNFAEANPEGILKVQTIIVDKDYKEISSINKVLPHVHVHVCHIHVLRVFDRETKKKSPGNSSKVYSILKRMSKCASPEEFESISEELESEASETFLQYFDENWRTCESAWVLHVRNESLSLGVDSTNFVESQNDKFKRILDRCKTLADAVRGILLLISNRDFESAYKNFREQASRAYIANDNDPDTKIMLKELSSWGARLLISELRLSKSLDILDLGETSCSCTFTNMFKMGHCKHIFQWRRVRGEALLRIEEVPPRWRKGYVNDMSASISELPVPMQSLLNQTPAPPKPKGKEQRYRECLKLCTEISNMVSLTGGRQNMYRMGVLKDIVRHWLSGKEVIVLPLNSDGTVDIEHTNVESQENQESAESQELVENEELSSVRNHNELGSPERGSNSREAAGCLDLAMDYNCADCKGPAPRKVCRKAGGNFLRYYFSCAARCRQQQSFFRWLKCIQCGSNYVKEGHFKQTEENSTADRVENSYDNHATPGSQPDGSSGASDSDQPSECVIRTISQHISDQSEDESVNFSSKKEADKQSALNNRSRESSGASDLDHSPECVIHTTSQHISDQSEDDSVNCSSEREADKQSALYVLPRESLDSNQPLEGVIYNTSQHISDQTVDSENFSSQGEADRQAALNDQSKLSSDDDPEDILDEREGFSLAPFKLPQPGPSARSRRKILSDKQYSERRTRGVSIPDGHVTDIGPGIWTVQSQGQGSLKYTVVSKSERCSFSVCDLKDRPCSHMYTCTCEDAKRWQGPCKHIFKVHTFCTAKGSDNAGVPRMSLLADFDGSFTLPVHKVLGRPRPEKKKSKKLGLSSDLCPVCGKKVQEGCSCVVCATKVHRYTACSLPDPSHCKDGMPNESIRVCRNCVCPRCRLPMVPQHTCNCIVCRQKGANSQCVNCKQSVHIDCMYNVIQWCFLCVENSESVVSVASRDILLSDEMLSDTIIFKAQDMLKKQFPHIWGLAYPITCEQVLSRWQKENETHNTYCPAEKNSPYLQIINTGHDHWITCFKKKGVENEIYVLNSTGSTFIGSFVEQQLALIMNCRGPSFKVAYYSVKIQEGVNECGPLAIAYATEIAFVGQHFFIDFKIAELRTHLLKCLLSGKMEPFPRNGKSQTSERLCSENVCVVCSCRLPEHFDKSLIQCSQCRTSCHWKCHGLVEAPSTRRWVCTLCK